MKQVTKEDFLKVYNAHAPNLFLRIMFKYFSSSMKESIGTKIIIWTFVISMIIAIVFNSIKGETPLRNVFLAIGCIPFFVWGIAALIAFIWDHARTTKVQKILGLTTEEYNLYAVMYVTE